MIHKAYINRYRQALKQNFPIIKLGKDAAENASSCLEENTPERPDQNQPGALEEQSSNMKEEVIKETAGSNAFHGFEQIAPGIFQFGQPASGRKEYTIPPELHSFFPKHENTQPQEKGELGFKRIDGLPGPFQNYSTPVFQFT